MMTIIHTLILGVRDDFPDVLNLGDSENEALKAPAPITGEYPFTCTMEPYWCDFWALMGSPVPLYLEILGNALLLLGLLWILFDALVKEPLKKYRVKREQFKTADTAVAPSAFNNEGTPASTPDSESAPILHQ